MATGLALALTATPPDLLVSGDGRHAALRLADGRLAFLRPRNGDFLRDMWGDALATDGDASFADLQGMACSADSCVANIVRNGRSWRLLATLSKDYVDRPVFEIACARADIVISARRMPKWCTPRWLRLDRAMLDGTGSVAVWLDSGRIDTAHTPIGDHPWRPQPAFGRRQPGQMMRVAQAASIDKPTPPAM